MVKGAPFIKAVAPSIKSVISYTGATAFVITLFAIYLAFQLQQNNNQLNKAEKERYQLTIITDEIKDSSDILTIFNMFYALTGDVKYKSTYKNIQNIRHGLAQKPKDYSNLYWFLSKTEQAKHHPLQAKQTLHTLLASLNFSLVEKKLLDEAELTANKLEKIELASIKLIDNANKKTNLNQLTNSTSKISSVQQQAIDLLTSSKYFDLKQQLMLPIDEFLESLAQRTQSNITRITQRQFILQIGFLSVLIASFFIYLYLYFFIRKNITEPVLALSQQLNLLKHNKNIEPDKSLPKTHEIGLLVTTFYQWHDEIQAQKLKLKLALQSSEQFWFEYNLITNRENVDETLHKKLGFNPVTSSDNKYILQEFIHPHDLPKIEASLEQCRQGKSSLDITYRRKTAEGGWLWMRTIGNISEFTEDQNAKILSGVHQDISAEHTLQFKEKLHHHIIEQLLHNTPLPKMFTKLCQEFDFNYDLRNVLLLDFDEVKQVYIKNCQFKLSQRVSNYVVDLLNHKKEELTLLCRNKPQGIVLTYQHPLFNSPKIRDYFENHALASVYINYLKNNKLLIVFSNQVISPNSPKFALLTFVADKFAFILNEYENRRNLRIAQDVFEQSHESILVTDKNSNVIAINQTFSEMTGYNQEDVLGKTPKILKSGLHDSLFYKNLWQSVNTKGYWHGSFWNKKKNGELFATTTTISKVFDESHNVQNYLAIFSDETQVIKQQEEIEFIAHFDRLTKLPNRTLVSDRFEQLTKSLKRSQGKIAVCFLDLDNFKVVNDEFGHDIGDELLIKVVKRINEHLRDTDTLSRQGGDEFLLLLNDLSSMEHCLDILQRIKNCVAEPFNCQHAICHISTSIGVTMYPNDAQDLDTLIRHANHAMYQTKMKGKNDISFYDITKEESERVSHSKLVELTQAFTDSQLMLYYQPKVNLKNGNIIGAEALIRWQHPNKGVLAPALFLPIMENTPLEIEVGFWVIKQGLQQLTLWQQDYKNFKLSVNVSSALLLQANFIDELKNYLFQYPLLNTQNFQLEILESSALGDLNKIIKVIHQCRELLNIEVALDDFGTGYSTLTHLRRLAVNELKIDQSFIFNCLNDIDDYYIVDGILKFSEVFNCAVIAEGVETIEHGKLLLLMGIEHAQGYAIAKPMSVTNFEQWFTHYQPCESWLALNKKIEKCENNLILEMLFGIEYWRIELIKALELEMFDNTQWPNINFNQSHCRLWLNAAKKQKSLSNLLFNQLENKLEDVYLLANELKDLYQQVDKVSITSQLSTFTRKVDEILVMLKHPSD